MGDSPRASIGPYRVLAELGRGGMGIVYLAVDPAIGREIAVKLIRADSFSDAEERAQMRLRFSREAAAAGRLNHPGIVTVYQLAEHEDTLYIAMEFVRGTSLDKLLAAGWMREPREVIRLLEQIAEALDYAHAIGVVHRDIKPANILVREDGKPKITDFGIAKISSQKVTQTGSALGTPEYMAPEQIMGLQVDGRADQFSLAVMAFFMLSGRKPFEASNANAVFLQIVQGDSLALHDANPKMPVAASEVFKRALAKSPADRFGACSEFVMALRAALEAAPASSAEVRRVGGRKAAYSVLAGILTLGVLAAAWLWQPSRPSVRHPVLSEPKRALTPDPVPAAATINAKDGLTYILITPVNGAHAFYLTRTEVTAAAFARFRPGTPFRGSVPVSSVTWNDARAYCEWIGGRLPSEAEWQYAAGTGEHPVSEIAWFSGNSGGLVHEVGGKRPNGFNLHDMQGNVWEWVADARGSDRVLRGGSALSGRQHVSVSSRWTLPPGSKDSMIGFRCAVDLPPVAR